MEGKRSKTQNLHLVSWNVTSWAQTISFIRRHHKSLDAWLDQHKIDILCLQETKTTREKLERDPSSFEASLKDWDTFWACCRTSESRGFNGVATFARVGLTRSADSQPFQSSQLNNEGRCIVTDHGAFVVINVYVPTSRRQELKHLFLSQLQTLVNSHRASGRLVVLAGDFNIARRPCDVHPNRRQVALSPLLGLNVTQSDSPQTAGQGTNQVIGPDIAQEVAILEKQNTSSSDGLKSDDSSQRTYFHDNIASRADAALKVGSLLLKYWNQIAAILATTQTKQHSFSSSSAPRWRVTAIAQGRGVFLGKAQFCEDDAKYFVKKYRELAAEPNDKTASVEFIEECLQKAGVRVTRAQREELVRIGQSSSSASEVLWLEGLLASVPLVDSFVTHHPRASMRYTCWDQSTNRRYENEGSRIDYILMSPELMAGSEAGVLSSGVAQHRLTKAQKEPEACGEGGESCKADDKAGVLSAIDVYSATAALAAATASGRWTPAPFDGSGICDGPAEAYLVQFQPPHTGMLYTPPQYSDHIGVSVLLDITPSHQLLSVTKAVRQCQPHRQQPSITSLFAAGGRKRSFEASTSNSDKTSNSSDKSSNNYVVGDTQASSSQQTPTPIVTQTSKPNATSNLSQLFTKDKTTNIRAQKRRKN